MGIDSTELGRVIGIGGVFFKSADHDRLQAWYSSNLGITAAPEGFMFRWRAHDQPDDQHFTVWSVFPKEPTYF